MKKNQIQLPINYPAKYVVMASNKKGPANQYQKSFEVAPSVIRKNGRLRVAINKDMKEAFRNALKAANDYIAKTVKEHNKKNPNQKISRNSFYVLEKRFNTSVAVKRVTAGDHARRQATMRAAGL
jgi:predicted metal-dependent hydrolase